MSPQKPIFVVAFTGHRNYDGSVDDRLSALVAQLYDDGGRIFRVGMAEGFDLSAAEVVLELKARCRDVVIEAIVPWPQFASRFGVKDRRRFEAVLRVADVVRYADSGYHPAVFRYRNNMLVAGADVIVAWWSGEPSGTEYTVRQARKAGAYVINLYADNQLAIEF